MKEDAPHRSKRPTFSPKREAFACLMALVLAVSACKCDPGGEDDCVDCGPFQEILAAMCDAMNRCPDAFYPIAVRNRQECIDTLFLLMTCSLKEIEVGDDYEYVLEQNVPQIDEVMVEGCVTWLETADCEVIRREMYCEGEECDAHQCGAIFVFEDDDDESDRIGPGEQCDRNNCVEGFFCGSAEFLEEEGLVICRVCEPLPVVGEPCPNYLCAADSYCKSDEEGDLRCAPLEEAGEPCHSDHICGSGFCNTASSVCDPAGFPGDTCGADGDCRGRFCHPVDEVCRIKQVNGEPCAFDAECESNECDSDSGRCGRANGAECRWSGQCLSGFCDEGIGECRPKRPAGEPCSSWDECLNGECLQNVCVETCRSSSDCGAGEYCDFVDLRCRSAKEDGERCSSDRECVSEVCNFSDRCGASPDIGEACSARYDCYPRGYCADGVCVPRKGPDQACGALDECLEPYLCLDGRCEIMNLECRPAAPGERCAMLMVCDETAYCDRMGGFTCKARPSEGEDCSRLVPCAPGFYCLGGSCQRRLQPGESCTSHAQCVEGYHCGLVDGVSVCSDGPSGRPCVHWDDDCPAGHFCDWDSERCSPYPGEGERCSWPDNHCAEGLYCDAVYCLALSEPGEDCDRFEVDSCVPGYYCDWDARECLPRAEAGEMCVQYDRESGRHCLLGHTCEWSSEESDYICVAPAEIGEPCSRDRDCVAGLTCLWNDEGERVCSERAGFGESCSMDQDCQSDICSWEHGCLASRECLMP